MIERDDGPRLPHGDPTGAGGREHDLPDQRVYVCSESCYGEFLDVPHRYAGWDDGPDRRTGAVGFDSSLQRVLAAGHPNRWAKATGRPMAMGRLAHEIGPGSSEEVRNVDRLTAVTDRPATWS